MRGPKNEVSVISNIDFYIDFFIPNYLNYTCFV